jgi:4-hydroxybenzoate polyprenyltransferase/phosphoserine phosphatase
VADADHPLRPLPLRPLVVDLDGTLTPADVSIESFVRFASQRPLNIMLLIIWLLRGRSFAKAMVARRSPVDAATIRLRPEVVSAINDARGAGRSVILASGSHRRNVNRIARHAGMFDYAMGSSARSNLKGSAKLAWLRSVLGDTPFDYIGDSRADTPLWNAAHSAYSTGHRPHAQVMALYVPKPRWRAVLKALRPHQWAKNALVFVPLATAGMIFNGPAIAAALLAAILFSAVASAIYQINDLIDIDADRAHPTKQHRPLAAGAISVPFALTLAITLLAGAFSVAMLVLPPAFAVALAAYLALTLAYSLRLKAVMTLDVIALGCLYTLRIIAGAAAVSVAVSFWLLLFSLFFFLSLGYLKRYTELAFAADPERLVGGRGYVGSDIEVVGTAGISAGMVSVLILALYIEDMRSGGIYTMPDLLWAILLGLLYWVNRVWMMARRGEVDGDPVAFALRDRRSLVLGALIGSIYVAARYCPI